jgi:hypothetical protein
MKTQVLVSGTRVSDWKSGSTPSFGPALHSMN